MTKELAGFKFIVANGFQSEVVKEVAVPVVEEQVVVEQTTVRVEELDVPAFMKGKRIPAPVSYIDNVVYVDFGQEEPTMQEKALSLVKQVWSGVADYIRRCINNTLKGGDK